MKKDLYQFLVCDYYATGEGSTISILITRAYPRSGDYSNTRTLELKKGITPKTIAAREFADRFGGWFLRGAENLEREEFLKRYKHHLPEYLVKLLNSEDQPGNLNFSQQLHLNFS